MTMKALKIDINTAMSICIRNGVKVFPIPSGKKFKIQVDKNGTLITYDKEIDGKLVANAMNKTYKYWGLKILNNAKQTKEESKSMDS